MPKSYRLIITGSIPLEFDEGDKIPSTKRAVQKLFEDQEVDPYDLDNLTLQLVPLTDEEMAAEEAELQRKLRHAERVGERLRRKRDNA
jgi:hypothetical protein